MEYDNNKFYLFSTKVYSLHISMSNSNLGVIILNQKYAFGR